MIVRTIKETTREYDKDGKVVRETVTETEEKDNNDYRSYYMPVNRPNEKSGEKTEE